MTTQESIIAADLRPLSHEKLVMLAAQSIHDLIVIRDMLRGRGLEAIALEVSENGVCRADGMRAAVYDEVSA